MTDDPSRGLNQHNRTGITVNSGIQPNRLEIVIPRLDNPQFWSSPGTPGDPDVDVEDVILEQKVPISSTDGTWRIDRND